MRIALSRIAGRSPASDGRKQLARRDDRKERGAAATSAAALLTALDSYYRSGATRGDASALSAGRYRLLEASDDLFAYVRDLPGNDSRLLVLVNLAGEPKVFSCEEPELLGSIVLAARAGREGEEVSGPVKVNGGEVLIVALRNGTVCS